MPHFVQTADIKKLILDFSVWVLKAVNWEDALRMFLPLNEDDINPTASFLLGTCGLGQLCFHSSGLRPGQGCGRGQRLGQCRGQPEHPVLTLQGRS